LDWKGLRGFCGHKLHRAACNKFGEVYSGTNNLPNSLVIIHTEWIIFDRFEKIFTSRRKSIIIITDNIKAAK
jgi:hypothetical protein